MDQKQIYEFRKELRTKINIADRETDLSGDILSMKYIDKLHIDKVEYKLGDDYTVSFTIEDGHKDDEINIKFDIVNQCLLLVSANTNLDNTPEIKEALMSSFLTDIFHLGNTITIAF